MSYNSFGHLFRVTTWGESHGPALGATIDFGKLRVPIDIRWNWRPLSDAPMDRATYSFSEDDSGQFLDAISINAEWETQIWFLIGVQYWDSFAPWGTRGAPPRQL